MDSYLNVLQKGDSVQARTALLGPVRDQQLALMKTLGTLKSYQEQLMEQASTLALADIRRTERWMAAATTLGALLAAFFGWRITRSVTRPLAHSVQVLNQVAQGDLTVQIAVDRRDEIGRLQEALARTVAALTEVVSDVRGNAQSVATASTQIAQGNQDLSQRTEQQASSLQQTAATMEELSTTVKHNAHSAQQANQLAQGASSVAARGGAVVGQVVETMKHISDSSHKIAEILSTIDDLAFLTNILALNAAVEAARAGDQGRGFAVVAGEVRSLAQRSAAAAREIKDLIRASVERVDQGTTLVDQAGRTMNEVVTSIKKVSDLVGEISLANQEQSTGVSLMGDAVNRMDQVTQQNAALVEESAAAASSLQQQAQALVQAVGVFRVAV